MRRRWARLAAVSGMTVCVLMAGTAVTAWGSAPPTVGNFRISVPRMPYSARLGGRALAFTIDVSQTSRYHVVFSVFFSMWARTNPGFQQTRGVTVRWLNPETGHWQKPYSVDRVGTYRLGPEDLGLPITRDQLFRIPVRIWFGSAARAGTYHILPWVDEYAVLNAAGRSIPAFISGTENRYTVHVIR
jgi:hypothetical protein